MIIWFKQLAPFKPPDLVFARLHWQRWWWSACWGPSWPNAPPLLCWSTPLSFVASSSASELFINPLPIGCKHLSRNPIFIDAYYELFCGMLVSSSNWVSKASNRPGSCGPAALSLKGLVGAKMPAFDQQYENNMETIWKQYFSTRIVHLIIACSLRVMILLSLLLCDINMINYDQL